jgi:enolase/phosphoenolpyruvate synthase/pyruvate phosphate dikinase
MREGRFQKRKQSHLIASINHPHPKPKNGACRSPNIPFSLKPDSNLFLQEGWVIANHILVSFHVAFISSVLALPAVEILKGDVLKFIFVSPETIISALFMYISFHTGIALHEMGHFLTAAKLNALNDKSQKAAERILKGNPFERVAGLSRIFLLAPYGRAIGIKREGLNYYLDAPYNFAVAAAGPRMSRNVAVVFLLPAMLLLSLGLIFNITIGIYIGRLCLGIGIVALLDRLFADPGKYKEFLERERCAKEKAASVARGEGWWESAIAARGRMLNHRIQEITHPDLGPVTAPWQFRNCGMGGRHTEKEYPESNISMQEAMFLILGAHDYQEAQEMTVRLQNRLKEIIEKAEGCRVMGIGLEGGIAPYIERGNYPLPEFRLWVMMKQTIEECGYRPGIDVAIALDPAMSELETAYRKQHKVPDSVGMYLFWRDRALTVMDREEVLDLYIKAIKDFDIPILSIEDGFSENDFEGWKKLLSTLGDRIFVIGDDLVTTNDATIAMAASKGLINTVLIKANQIGSLYETILAMLVALGKGMELVVSHRSKSPNDDMEAQIALAVNALGLKAGGGANTERLIKYHAVTELMQRGLEGNEKKDLKTDRSPYIRKIYAYEEPTNAGIPTVGASVDFALPESGVTLRFRGATPLGTSAGTGEAIHLIDSVFERAEYPEVIDRHPTLFVEIEPGVYIFEKSVKKPQVLELDDEELLALFERVQRYDGKGCLNAVENVSTVIAPAFTNKVVEGITLKDIDQMLLSLELRVAERRGKISDSTSPSERIQVMQRKQNLGMNAMLSVSLAMARGLAYLKGQDLFEMLREEMLVIIEKLTRMNSIKIAGSQFNDYVNALQKVNQILADQNKELHEVLRDVTGIYREADKGFEWDLPSPTKREETEKARVKEPPLAQPPDHYAPESVVMAEEEIGAPEAELIDGSLLTEEEKSWLGSINNELLNVFRNESDSVTRHDVLHKYIKVKQAIAHRTQRFGIANNRIFISPDEMFVPYLVGDTLVVHNVHNEVTDTVFSLPLPKGKIITDELLNREAGVRGEPIDLECELCDFNQSHVVPIHVVRIRDFVEHLRKVNESANRSEAVYVLRLLVARLSLFSFKKQLNAKNLQSEVHSLFKELMRFINSTLSGRLPLLVRILVRDIAAVVTRPKLIDRLWNDTIDLAEIHIRGSAIVNELRRSSHHAMGRHTLKLAQAYLKYLNSGDTSDLEEMGADELAPADEKAREAEQPKRIVNRIIEDLQQLLGSSETIARIREWQTEYKSTLVRCGFGKSLHDEMNAVVEGMQRGNRWVYYHHLRIIKSRILEFVDSLPSANGIVRRLDALLGLKPDEVLFEGERAEEELRNCVNRFVGDVQQSYQTRLFDEMENILTSYERKELYTTFIATCQQRKNLRVDLEKRAFPEQRLLLFELDCLLEEMSYLVLRQIASEYEEKGVDFAQCLEIIHASVQNLTRDGLYSRQLHDLAAMLKDATKTYAEVKNIIEQIHRNYHHLVQRVIAPFEKIRDKIGFTEEELRAALANMQRYMHDLNNVAYFTDIAHSYIEDKTEEHSHPIGVGSTPPREPFDVIHLSHYDEIKQRIESDDLTCNLRDLYGSKGSGLLYISYLNIPTRDGFILPTTLPQSGLHQGLLGNIKEVVTKHLRILEADIAKRDGIAKTFSDPKNPLLLAVRAGSVFSMPGILSTVLFVGINDEIAEGLAKQDPWCAYDAYRRFLAMYGQAVWGVDMESHNIVEETKRRYKVKYKYDLPWEGMKEIAEKTKDILREEGHREALEQMLQNPIEQLFTAIHAVFHSWSSEAARRYREIKGICNSWQTVAIVQEMALGNRKNEEIREGMDETRASLTGVIPRTSITDLGMRTHLGDFKFSAAGDDLVGGLTKSISFRPIDELGSFMPMLNRRLRHNIAKLRRFLGTDQEVEFTVESGILSILQSRAAEIGKNKQERAFKDAGEENTHGIGIRGSAFRGVVAFDKEDLDELSKEDLSKRDDVDGMILLLESPSPEYIPLILSADALLSAKGGSTSHAAIAINGIQDADYSAVMSATGLHVDARKHEAVLTTRSGQVHHTIRKHDVISIHGTTGNVYVGTRPVI